MTIGAIPHLFCFGLGYTATALAKRLLGEGWRVSGTCRRADKAAALARQGIAAHLFDRGHPLEGARALLAEATDVLSSVPPDDAGDAVLDHHGDDLAAVGRSLRWVGYLSTTAVYGDSAGACVDEETEPRPSLPRAVRRLAAERRWLALADHGLPVHVFRLAGIYGPRRSVLDQVRAGSARRIDKPGHVFSRIHVDDAATVLRASMARPDPRRIYNVCDDLPAEPADVVACACRLLGVPPPPLVDFAEAARQMSDMALSFWQDQRRVDNARIKRELGVRLAYPDYRAGLEGILAGEHDVASHRPAARA